MIAARPEAAAYVLINDDVFLIESENNCDPHMLIPVTTDSDPGFLLGTLDNSQSTGYYVQSEPK